MIQYGGWVVSGATALNCPNVTVFKLIRVSIEIIELINGLLVTKTSLPMNDSNNEIQNWFDKTPFGHC